MFVCSSFSLQSTSRCVYQTVVFTEDLALNFIERFSSQDALCSRRCDNDNDMVLQRSVGLERYQETHPISTPNNIGHQRYQYSIPIPILVYSIAMTMKCLKTLWWWQWLCLINSSISAWCPDKWLQLSEYKSQVELNNRSLACGQCWLLSDWYCIGCQNNKKYLPNTNTTQYLWILPSTQWPNTSIVLTLQIHYTLENNKLNMNYNNFWCFQAEDLKTLTSYVSRVVAGENGPAIARNFTDVGFTAASYSSDGRLGWHYVIFQWQSGMNVQWKVFYLHANQTQWVTLSFHNAKVLHQT